MKQFVRLVLHTTSHNYFFAPLHDRRFKSSRQFGWKIQHLAWIQLVAIASFR